jgi:putative membrane protein insertion efficiency factor
MRRIFGTKFRAATAMDYPKRENVTVAIFPLLAENLRYLRKRVFKPYLKMLCMRLILFYQRHLSSHQCKFRPTCSQYTLECINNHGVIVGIFLGAWRILRCHPWTKGGYEPAPERYYKSRWLV